MSIDSVEAAQDLYFHLRFIEFISCVREIRAGGLGRQSARHEARNQGYDIGDEPE